MKNLFIRSAVALAVSSLFTVATVSASEQPNAADLVGKAYGGLHLTHIDLDSKRWLTSSPLSSLNNGDGFGGELGYRASENTEFRLGYSHINLDAKNGGFDKPNSSSIAFDALYFPTAKNFYLLGGFSQLDVVDTKLSSNLGLGYRHYLSEKTALYLEAKAHYQFDNYHDDFTTQLGFTYFFGDSKSSSSKSKAAKVATGFMATQAFANLTQAEKDAYANLSQYEKDAFAKMSPAERTAFLNMSAEERSLYLSMSPAERALYANMTQAQKDAYANMTPAERSAFMAKLAAEKMVDADGDGVADALDKCENSSPMYAVDETGCTKYIDDVESINLLVNFANNSSVVEPEYFNKIEEVAQFLEANKSINVVIEGHASVQGNDAYNKFLSQKRADAIVSMLTTKHGIDADRLSAIGYGEEKLLNTDNTAAAHAENRRIIATMSVDKRTPIAR